MLLAHKCRRVLWLSTINSNSMHQNLLPFFSRIRSGRQALEDWTSVFNRLLPWISHFWHTQGQCNEALPLRYLRSSGGEFRLLLKTGMQLCLSPWQPPQESLMPVTKLTLKKAVWIQAKTLRQNPPHLIVIKILFCTHNPPSSPDNSNCTPAVTLRPDPVGPYWEWWPWVLQRQSVKRISSPTLFTLWFHVNSYVGTSKRTQQAMVWHSPRISKEDNKLQQHSLTAQHPPSISACLQESQHTTVLRSQRKVVNSGQKLRGLSAWLGFSEVFYQVRARTWIYWVRKWAQQTTTTVPTPPLATSSSELLMRIIRVSRLLAVPGWYTLKSTIRKLSKAEIPSFG